MHSCAVSWLRRAEIALWVTGLSLLGWVLAATLTSRDYQARQERALFPVVKRDVATVADADPLVLGRIDDCDETFVNGRKVGGLGDMPAEVRRLMSLAK